MIAKLYTTIIVQIFLYMDIYMDTKKVIEVVKSKLTFIFKNKSEKKKEDLFFYLFDHLR